VGGGSKKIVHPDDFNGKVEKVMLLVGMARESSDLWDSEEKKRTGFL